MRVRALILRHLRRAVVIGFNVVFSTAWFLVVLLGSAELFHPLIVGNPPMAFVVFAGSMAVWFVPAYTIYRLCDRIK